MKHILKQYISSARSHEPPYRADANVDSTDATARRCCGVGVRVSAFLRRGAAPYGDGSLCSQAPSHLISLSILGVPEEFRPEFYKEFCVRQIGTKSPSWSLWLSLLSQSALFKGIWPPHTRHLGPPVTTPGSHQAGSATRAARTLTIVKPSCSGWPFFCSV